MRLHSRKLEWGFKGRSSVPGAGILSLRMLELSLNTLTSTSQSVSCTLEPTQEHFKAYHFLGSTLQYSDIMGMGGACRSGKISKSRLPGNLVVEPGAEPRYLDFFLYLTVTPTFSKLREEMKQMLTLEWWWIWVS